MSEVAVHSFVKEKKKKNPCDVYILFQGTPYREPGVSVATRVCLLAEGTSVIPLS